jgi:hypothetical protein
MFDYYEKRMRRIWWAAGIAAVIILGGAGWYIVKPKMAQRGASEASTVMVDAGGYQAVFLPGGQVYFGKLAMSAEWLTLTDVYYLQSQRLQLGQEGQTPQVPGNFELVKLGTELHGPADEMYFPRTEVLYWQNLRTDSRVIRAIDEYKSARR